MEYQKQKMIGYCFLDADEVMSDGLVEEIKNEMKSPVAMGYFIPMTFVFLGKHFRYGKESWRYFMRLFNKKSGNFNNFKVHEKIELNGNTQKFTNNIYHYSYRNLFQYFEKFNRYSSYGALMAYQKGKRKSLLVIIVAVPLNFMKYYFVELNFLNGLSGFYWSALNAFYHFAKYIKIHEMFQSKLNGEETETIIDTALKRQQEYQELTQGLVCKIDSKKIFEENNV
ncbi:MAG: glycosyltransferase family 2 protein [Bacteroidetes bacterium]|nr:glycosyltransferase family 2 protein [Bacteroidota bacterium]MBS1930149.1 glycosyltransferase family 2 protein [Bacteroidota bacterium]